MVWCGSDGANLIGLDPRRSFDPDVWSAALQRLQRFVCRTLMGTVDHEAVIDISARNVGPPLNRDTSSSLALMLSLPQDGLPHSKLTRAIREA